MAENKSMAIPGHENIISAMAQYLSLGWRLLLLFILNGDQLVLFILGEIRFGNLIIFYFI
ncbi:hypothetical protein NC652_030950 [Populus alba x Populus x berolinensis]|uniref:Uncharacterized protein n=1 Tax=Populus alba x Populus x berolinensis TaxID=444605 RepID=A0AAD6Q2I4_9ROSI|nr:hypothetical protein NC652_030950 [Populus alba x Populus x berolinensis]KAJ6974768.1 hypothetical protein NC653_030796 [Populus alba x Populus x berolinensis]